MRRGLREGLAGNRSPAPKATGADGRSVLLAIVLLVLALGPASTGVRAADGLATWRFRVEGMT